MGRTEVSASLGAGRNVYIPAFDVQHAFYSSAPTLDWTSVVDRSVCIFGSRQKCLHPCIRCTACLILKCSNCGLDGCCGQKCLASVGADRNVCIPGSLHRSDSWHHG